VRRIGKRGKGAESNGTVGRRGGTHKSVDHEYDSNGREGKRKDSGGLYKLALTS
jgi:hypothetical protein